MKLLSFDAIITIDQYIADLFNSVLNYGINKVCLTEGGISVKDYFRYLTNAEQTEHGIVLTGQKLYGY